MKRVGIVTMFGEYNFGNRLQNYAVQEVLKNEGLEVETIKYIMSNYQGPIINNKVAENRLIKFKKFNELIKFSDKVLYIDLETPEDFADSYDYIILGSDQIWNYSFTNYFSHKAFGSFAQKHKRVSFSASFGINYLPQENSELYNICQKYLKEMKAISVRELAGQKIAQNLTGRDDIEVLIDPTMMLDIQHWENIMRRPKQLKTDKFIVKSFLGDVSENINKELARVAKENSCEIIDISNANSHFYDVGPEEFLYLEKNAFLVATDSFHSCVFGILFSTPFVVFERQDKNENMYSRIETLLDKFDMKNRIFNGKISNEIFKDDFSKKDSILQTERKKAHTFLKRALD